MFQGILGWEILGFGNKVIIIFPMKLIYRDLVNLGNVVWANTTKSFLNIMSTKKRCAIIKEKETCKVTQRRGLIAL